MNQPEDIECPVCGDKPGIVPCPNCHPMLHDYVRRRIVEEGGLTVTPELIPADDPRAPKYWMQETGGKLGPAIKRYLEGQTEQPDDIALIRAYLRQWIDAPVWAGGAKLDELRRKVREIRTRQHIDFWLEDAQELVIDPL